MADINKVFEKLDELIDRSVDQSAEQQQQTMQVWKAVSQSLEKEEDVGTVLLRLQQTMEQANDVDESTREVMKGMEQALRSDSTTTQVEKEAIERTTKAIAPPLVSNVISHTGEGIMNLIQSIQQSITGLIDEILGPIKQEIIDPLMGIGSGLAAFGQGLVGSMKRTAEASTGTLEFFKKEEKEEDREKRKEERGLSDLLVELIAWVVGAGLAVLGGIIGTGLGAIVAPFKLMKKAASIFSPIVRPLLVDLKKIGGLLKKIPIVEKIISPIRKLFGWFGKFARGFTKILDFLKAQSGLLGKFIGGFRLGFKWLIWPIEAIFAIINFVKAFQKEQGDLKEKIKAGLDAAIQGFLDIPVRLLGWISDWFLSLFGAKPEGGTAKMMKEGISKMLSIIVDGLASGFRAMKDFIADPKGTLKNIWNSLKDLFSSLVGGLIGVIKSVLLSIADIIPDWAGGDELKALINKIKVPGEGSETNKNIKTQKGTGGRSLGKASESRDAQTFAMYGKGMMLSQQEAERRRKEREEERRERREAEEKKEGDTNIMQQNTMMPWNMRDEVPEENEAAIVNFTNKTVGM